MKRKRRSGQGKRSGAAHEPQARRIVAAFLLVTALLTAAMFWAIHQVVS